MQTIEHIEQHCERRTEMMIVILIVSLVSSGLGLVAFMSV